MRHFLTSLSFFILISVLIAQDRATLTKILTIWGDSDKPYFGSEISNIGDINNDGYEDLAVIDIQSPEPLGVALISQRAYIYFGGTVFDTIPDISFRKSFGYYVIKVR